MALGGLFFWVRIKILLMNTFLFNLINGWAGQWPWLDTLMILSAKHLWVLLLVVLIVKVGFNRRWHHMAAVAIGSALVARLGIVALIKWLYVHPRPDLVLETINAVVVPGTGNSFPSGHTSFAFALATGVYLHDKKLGRWYLAAAALIGFARIFIGVHWPLDILAGVFVGVATALIVNRIYRKLKPAA